MIDDDTPSEPDASDDSLGEQPPPEPPLIGGSLAEPIAATALLAIAASVGFQPKHAASWTFYGLLFAPLLLVAGYFAWFRLARETLGDLLRPRRGDFTLGTVIGFLLVGSVWLGRTQIFPRFGDARSWLFAVYFQLGDARVFEALLPSFAILVFALAHELFFHGVVQTSIEERFGPRKAYWSSVVATAIVYVPSIFLLEARDGGNNPLFLLAAVLSALVLGALRRASGRLAPGVIARAIFLYFSIAQFRLPGL